MRYSTSLDAPTGRVSYHAVYEKPTYDFCDIGTRTRSQVRRGLKSCAIEPITLEQLADQGWPLHCDTLGRQGREVRIDREDWRRRWLSAADLPGFSVWGAFIDKRLVASQVTFKMGAWCYFIYSQTDRESLKLKVSNAMIFHVTRETISQPDVQAIFIGMHSLDAPASVDDFKFLMGYAAKPVRQQVVFHPWLRPAINRYTYTMVKGLKSFRTGHPALRKAEGLIRFYLEGQRPLQEQTLPPVLQAAVMGQAT